VNAEKGGDAGKKEERGCCNVLYQLALCQLVAAAGLGCDQS